MEAVRAGQQPDGLAGDLGPVALLVPRRHSSVWGENLKSTAYQSWEEEPLVSGFKWSKDARSYVIQYMCNRSIEDPVKD